MITTTLYRSSRGLFMVFLFALSACTSTQAPAPDSGAAPLTERSASDWLRLAETAAPEQQLEYRLKAARLFEQQGQYTAGADILRGIPKQQLQGPAIGEYLQLSAGAIERQNGSQAALDWLTAQDQQSLLHRGTPQQQATIHGVMADLEDRTGNHLTAANRRMALAGILTGKQARSDNQDAIWRSLLQVPSPALQQSLDREPDTVAQGWYELALLGQTLEGDIEQQRNRLDRWQHRRPTHPAALLPPGEMGLLRQLADARPAQIAVFLPLQGQLKNAGRAIRDGLLSAHFDAGQSEVKLPVLRFYDTEANPDMAALYRKAVNQGAELIIGPLTKNRVAALLKNADGRVPVIALNYGPEDLASGENVYQFGLSSIDDARAAAELAMRLDYRRAFVIHGTDNQSARSAAAFQQAWQALEGETVAAVEFDSERSTSERIKQGLHVDLSQQRARRLESITATSLEYNPRRRQDIDFVYLPVGSQQARSIKPLLAFHFAQDLPVYATSRVNRGKPDPRRDADLNGIYFTDTPWALGAMPQQRQRIEQYIERGGAPAKNLYALGIDAYQLAPRIPQLLYSPGLVFQGTTGVLSLSGEGVILRRPSWAQFRGGRATLMEIETTAEVETDERMDAIETKKQHGEQQQRYHYDDG